MTEHCSNITRLAIISSIESNFELGLNLVYSRVVRIIDFCITLHVDECVLHFSFYSSTEWKIDFCKHDLYDQRSIADTCWIKVNWWRHRQFIRAKKRNVMAWKSFALESMPSQMTRCERQFPHRNKLIIVRESMSSEWHWLMAP